MSSSVAIATSVLFEKIVYPFSLMLNGTNVIENVYETVHSIPILTIFRENVALISITLYLMWYIKVCLSVSLSIYSSKLSLTVITIH